MSDNKKHLTDIELISYLLSQTQFSEGQKMKGKIRPISRQRKCPVCNKTFEEIPKLGYICAACKTIPTRFLIDIHWNGKRYFITSDKQGYAIDSYQRAFNLLALINTEINDHSFDPSKYVSSEQKNFWCSILLDKFLEHKLPHIAPSYKKDYERFVEIHKSFWKNKDVREIRKVDIIEYLDYLKSLTNKKAKKHNKNKKLSNKTIKNILDNFKTFMIYLKNDLELINKIPPFPKISYSTNIFSWFDRETQNRIFEAIPDRFKPIIYFMLRYGVRPGEARALKVKNIDLKNETIIIDSTFSGTEIKNRRKGRGAKPLILPIVPELKPFLKNKIKNSLPEAFVFINPVNGKPFSAWSLDLMWRKIRKKFNLDKKIRLYDFTRHSLASQLVNEGIPLNLIQKILGHSSSQMTQKYAHVDLSSIKNILCNREQTVNNQDLTKIKSFKIK